MTSEPAGDQAEERASGPAVRQPPWLWVYLVLFPLVSVLGAAHRIADSFHAILSGHFRSAGEEDLYWMFVVFEVLPLVFLLVALLAVLTPGQRGRDVRRQYRFARSDAAEVVEIGRFVAELAPGVVVRFSPRGGQLARAYPVGFTRTRIGVFAPFLELWQEDREAAEAVLRHELAHVQQREHLIIGLGSPFSSLMRTWLVLYLPLTLLPVVLRWWALRSAPAEPFGLPYGPLLNSQTVEAVALATLLLLLPVAAIWLAELAADAWAAEAVGAEPVVRALARRRALTPLRSRVLGLFEHPPTFVRRWLVRHRPSGLAGRAVTLAAWPAALVADLLVLLATALPAYDLIRLLPGHHLDLARFLSVHYLREPGTLALLSASVLLLVAWPVLGSRTVRSSRPIPRPSAVPYWLAAALPAALIAVAALADDSLTPFG